MTDYISRAIRLLSNAERHQTYRIPVFIGGVYADVEVEFRLIATANDEDALAVDILRVWAHDGMNNVAGELYGTQEAFHIRQCCEQYVLDLAAPAMDREDERLRPARARLAQLKAEYEALTCSDDEDAA